MEGRALALLVAVAKQLVQMAERRRARRLVVQRPPHLKRKVPAPLANHATEEVAALRTMLLGRWIVLQMTRARIMPRLRVRPRIDAGAFVGN